MPATTANGAAHDAGTSLRGRLPGASRCSRCTRRVSRTREAVRETQKTIDRAFFEAGAAPGCHEAWWTDEQGRVWRGIPLWLLAGWVVDENVHQQGAFDRDLAVRGYPIELISRRRWPCSSSESRSRCWSSARRRSRPVLRGRRRYLFTCPFPGRLPRLEGSRISGTRLLVAVPSMGHDPGKRIITGGGRQGAGRGRRGRNCSKILDHDSGHDHVTSGPFWVRNYLV